MDPFVAEIRAVTFNFPPKGWAFCNGQLLPISQNTALFSLLGTYYGGDGKSTFGLPDLQGRAAMHAGQGPGLSRHDLGERSGQETVTLLASEMPAHAHPVHASVSRAESRRPGVGGALAVTAPGERYVPGTAVGNGALVSTAATTLASAGGGQPHNNMMPYLTLNYIIALQGIFPPRG